MKKVTLCILLLATVLVLSGCNLWTVGARLDAFEEAVDNRLDAVENAAEAAIASAIVPNLTPSAPADKSAGQLTKEEAEAIALDHAGFTAAEVSYLWTEYEIDDRIPHYDVRFNEGYWEYEFEIHAETGAILSFDKDT